MSDIKDELLKQGDYNVVIVDWGHGSMALYGQASANTRVVGAQIAQLIKFLQANTEARPEDMHIIGHSLGSHVAGYAGERLQYLGRITGLDPAQPFFEHMDKAVRLDPTDALFVDVIHTDGDRFYSTDFGLGMDEPCGHVDYFPNGGHDQPGCEADPITHWAHEGLIAGTSEFVACNHLRSYHFFNETINSVCPFEAYRCDSEDDFNSGKCVPCSGEACGFMGLHADRTKPAGGATNVKYYLKTGTSWPYCRYHYKVSLDFAASSNGYESEERGQMFVHLTGSTGQTHTVQVTDSSVYFKSGQTYTYLLTSPTDLGDIHDVTLRWHHASAVLDVGSWNLLGLRHPQLAIDAVHVSSGETHTTFNFCEHGTSVETDHSQVFSRKC
ncbi:hypothetical protein BaRGS_00007267 [Batillaria attramentaria]|uniref:PLAT domain-containing protein n=1 Tax=Batillaria attramentaria TaxID=370345 RepID=A0ABD0LQE9_9CAEN